MRSIIFALTSMFVISCAADEDPPTDEQVETVVTPDSGCTQITYCNAPGTLGTICQQTAACSDSATMRECYSDLAAIHCNCHSPAQIRFLDGRIHALRCPQ